MPRTIFVNLPVKDLEASKAFLVALGFTADDRLSNDKGACLVFEENVSVMLLTEDFFGTFLNGPVADAHAATEVILCLSCDSRAQVDETYATAIANGAKPWKPAYEADPMYGTSFQDLDGHVWELVHMGA